MQQRILTPEEVIVYTRGWNLQYDFVFINGCISYHEPAASKFREAFGNSKLDEYGDKHDVLYLGCYRNDGEWKNVNIMVGMNFATYFFQYVDGGENVKKAKEKAWDDAKPPLDAGKHPTPLFRTDVNGISGQGGLTILYLR